MCGFGRSVRRSITELIQPERRFGLIGRVEVISRIKDVVSQEFEYSAVVLICPRLCDGVPFADDLPPNSAE
jgi:hypothetical protein